MKRTILALIGLGLAAGSLAAQLTLEVPASRSRNSIEFADQAARQFAKNVAVLTRKERANRGIKGPFSLPISVILRHPGQASPATSRGREPDLNIEFDSGPTYSFPADYQNLLQAVFDRVKPRLTATFGNPFSGGTVRILNFENEIGERDAVAGGYYLFDPLGAPIQSIRFPVYADSVGIKAETAAVNFVHTLLLAYMGNRQLPNDAWREGLVRAATIQICRTPGALPATLDQASIEQALESTYEIGATYDWCNQKGLISQNFIAPNLRNQLLPIGGSTGGLYLVRYLMAGSAFQKVLVQYPTFGAEFMSRYYASPSADLGVLAQSALDAAGGIVAAKVEDRVWSEWAKRQYILDSGLYPGLRLMVQPFAIADGLAGNDFGVFGIQAHFFRIGLDGSETLLSDTGYPIYWSPDFTRIFASGQDDRIDVSLGYGSVAPNFGDAFGGTPYRVTVDVPFQDELQRIFLPAGAIATASNPAASTFYGSLTGVKELPNVTYSIRATWQGNSITIPVSNFAFGGRLDASWQQPLRSVIIEVLRTTSDGTSVIFTRIVNKGSGPLALDLHVGADQTVTLGNLPAGLSMAGLVGTPRSASLPSLLSQPVGQTLASRWNASAGKYELFPETGVVTAGQGFFTRLPSSTLRSYSAEIYQEQPLTVKLRPGWNIVTNPLNEATLVSDLKVLVASGFERGFADAIVAQQVGANVFGFQRGANDPITGFPETGSLVPATTIEAGQGYYVRVLAPEGAVLVFTPASLRSRDRETGSLPVPTFLGEFSVSGANESIRMELGVAPKATSGFDPKFDSALPPKIGGLQLSTGTNRLYRDIRKSGAVQSVTVAVEGLRKGATYKAKFETTIGQKAVRIFDGSKSYLMPSTGEFTFVAQGETRRFRILIAR